MVVAYVRFSLKILSCRILPFKIVLLAERGLLMAGTVIIEVGCVKVFIWGSMVLIGWPRLNKVLWVLVQVLIVVWLSVLLSGWIVGVVAVAVKIIVGLQISVVGLALLVVSSIAFVSGLGQLIICCWLLVVIVVLVWLMLLLFCLLLLTDARNWVRKLLLF